MQEKMKCFIVDDEEKDRENLRLLLKDYCPEIEIIGEAGETGMIINGLSNNDFDFAFLDVQLGESSIFDILDKIDNVSFKIIFVSAHNEFAVDGYKYDASGYLLKPIDPMLLRETVNKVTQSQSANNSLSFNVSEVGNLYSKIHDIPKISIADAKETHIIRVPEVLYCMSNGNYTTLVRQESSDLVISKNLKTIEAKFSPFGFFRIHRSYLINLNQISSLIKDDGGYVVMSDGKKLSIARDSKKSLYEVLNKL